MCGRAGRNFHNPKGQVTIISNFINIKAENNISKEFKVMFDTSDDNDLIIKMLKLKDNVVKDNLGIKAYKVFSKRVRATIFFEKVETEADKALKLAQIEMLKKSIQRRKNLLSNEGYVTKAPQNIVEQERKNLALEEEKLKNLELDNKQLEVSWWHFFLFWGIKIPLEFIFNYAIMYLSKKFA